MSRWRRSIQPVLPVQRPEIVSGCGKQRYADKKAALSAINTRMNPRHRHNRPENGLRAYPCSQCRGWHISHRPKF